MKIYIVLTYTGTILSKIIKLYTKHEFAHISISLDEKLNELYSFGRLNPYNPFIGGFVHEGINIGTFKRFKKTIAGIYSLEITDEQYNKIKNSIQYIEKNREKYKFNIIGLFLVGLKIRYKRKKQFYCAEFVKHLLDESNVIDNNTLPEIISPEDFKKIVNLKLEYKGLLQEY